MNFNRPDVLRGVLASFTGTLALSAIMVVKQMMGMLPQMNPIADLVALAHSFAGTPRSPLVGWLLHFALGSLVWGTLFAILRPAIPGSGLVKGLLFAVGAWILMMMLFLPLTGQGFFGLNAGPVIPLMTLLLHLVYGAVLGITFARLSDG